MPKPVISVESKVFWKEPYKLTGTRVTFVRPSIHDGKLAQLMHMPMDIFLEVRYSALKPAVVRLTHNHVRLWRYYTPKIY